MSCHIAGDGQHLMRLSRGAPAELQSHDRRDIARTVLDRRVVQQELVVLGTSHFQLGADLVAHQGGLKDRAHPRCDPFWKTFAHGLGPFVRLAAIGRQRIVAANQIPDLLADVIGEILMDGAGFRGEPGPSETSAS